MMIVVSNALVDIDIETRCRLISSRESLKLGYGGRGGGRGVMLFFHCLSSHVCQYFPV